MLFVCVSMLLNSYDFGNDPAENKQDTLISVNSATRRPTDRFFRGIWNNGNMEVDSNVRTLPQTASFYGNISSDC